MSRATHEYIQAHRDRFLEELEGWLSPPFDSSLRDGNFCARGSAHDPANLKLKARRRWAGHRYSPNEKFCLDNYCKGIRTVSHFLEQYGEQA